MDMKPTSAKLSVGGLCVTLILSLAVIVLEVKKPAVSHSNILYLSCVSTRHLRMKMNRLLLTCENGNKLVQPVIDRNALMHPIVEDDDLKENKLFPLYINRSNDLKENKVFPSYANSTTIIE